jgi:hydrogenase expression/formation protein HypC
MCLTIPGKIEEISEADPTARTARVDFSGIVKTVNLLYLPEAKAGDYVLVHAGFATEIVPEREALEALRYTAEMQALAQGASP